LSSGAAEKLASVLPRFNVTALDCCAAVFSELVSSVTSKTLQQLTLRGASLNPAAAAVLGRSLPEMSSLEELRLTGVSGGILKVEEMETLFEGINETFSALKKLFLGILTQEVALLHSSSAFTSFPT